MERPELHALVLDLRAASGAAQEHGQQVLAERLNLAITAIRELEGKVGRLGEALNRSGKNEQTQRERADRWVQRLAQCQAERRLAERHVERLTTRNRELEEITSTAWRDLAS